MIGPLALHGGGEFHPGDEPFLRALLEAAETAARARTASDTPGGTAAVAGADAAEKGKNARSRRGRTLAPIVRRVVIVPTAAGGERPDLAAGDGTEAFRRVAAAAGIPVDVEGVLVVDAASAARSALAARIAEADVVYLPGGDPGRLAAILPGSLAWGAVLRARARGAVVAGASAGAMILAPWTWTPRGGAVGLALVPGIVVVPHAERVAHSGWAGTFAEQVPTAYRALGRLGLDERTGVISGNPVPGGRAWRVVGEGRVHWSPPGERTVRTYAAGATLVLPG